MPPRGVLYVVPHAVRRLSGAHDPPLCPKQVRDPLAPTLLEVVRTPDNSSRTYCVASAPAPARAGESDVVYAFGATSATMWVYVFHPP